MKMTVLLWISLTGSTKKFDISKFSMLICTCDTRFWSSIILQFLVFTWTETREVFVFFICIILWWSNCRYNETAKK